MAAPTINTVAGNGIINATEATGGVTITGTADPNAAIKLTLGGILIDVTANGAGAWSYTLLPDDFDNMGQGGELIVARYESGGMAAIKTIKVDTVAPESAIAVVDDKLKAGETSTVVVSFDEAVTGLTADDLAVANGTLGTLSTSDGGFTWTATFTPATGTVDATNGITLNNTGVSDLAGNPGLGTTDSNNYAIDHELPTATIALADKVKAGETPLVTITFNEEVTGFTNDDLIVANGTLSPVSSADGITWTATFSPNADTTDTTNLITLKASSVFDAVDNTNSGATNSNNYEIDTLRPTATIVVADDKLKMGDTSLVTITFNEVVTGFTNGDLTVQNGYLTDVYTTDDGVTWKATFQPGAGLDEPANAITLKDASVADLAGNTNDGPTLSNNYAIDAFLPSATSIVLDDYALKAGDASPTVTITFSEAVDGFTTDDLTVANGTLTDLASANGITWTATYIPNTDTTDATNVITLKASSVFDDVGNTNSSALSSANFEIDNVAPTLVGTALIDSNETITLTFSEAMATPVFGNIDTRLNGVVEDIGASGVSVSANEITVSTTGALIATDFVVISYPAGTITDLAENPFAAVNLAIGGTGNNNIDLHLQNDSYLIFGNAGDDTLMGGEGNDTLNGGTGGDAMAGGLGNDTYIVDSASDVVTENAGAGTGTDLVKSSITYTLVANVENLTLTGSAAINGTGNALDNTITGNAAVNTLDGGAGNDILIGGGGNDTLTGGDGNDRLDGGLGNDNMTGGAGDDTYVVGSALDTVTEIVGEGDDTVESSITYTLLDHFEKLTLTGTANINGTGNALDNTITGNDGNNQLDGDGGIDAMAGGFGNDTYIVNSTADTVTEGVNAGTDLVRSSATSYTLGTNVENLTLTGSGDIDGTGNGLANIITGNDGNNVLDGGTDADPDFVDRMVGGLGNDTFKVRDLKDVVTELPGAGDDTVQSWVTYTLTANVEKLTLMGVADINGTGNALDNIMTGNDGANVLNGDGGIDTMTGGLGNDTYVVDSLLDEVVEGGGGGDHDLIMTSIDYSLSGEAFVEDLTLTGSAINGTGNDLANIITGNSGNNVLDGGLDDDTLVGGKGNDIYIVDSALDVVTEAAGEGTDTVHSTAATYTLSANVENLILDGHAAINGTGNELANTITGNDAVNTLTGGAGNDTLDGGGGADTLIGGDGNDTYIVGNAVTITEGDGENSGTDLIQSSIDFNLSTDGANVENLTLTGTAITGTGNALANTITGNDLANVLDGGAGVDRLVGGAGNDTYYVDDSRDVVTELAGAGTGTDTVHSTAATYTLSANVENLILDGHAAINGTGNSGNNTIIGNDGNNVLNGGGWDDVLIGGDGNDTLTGGTGTDIFVFDTALSLNNIDKITDFSRSQFDKIHLDDDIFTAVGAAIDAAEFKVFVDGRVTLDADDRLIYNKDAGMLYYDADGSGAAFTPVQIAIIGNHAALDQTDFVVVP